MNISQALHTALKATTGVTSLSSNRIYPIVAPQGVKMPYIIYQQISNVPVHAFVADPKIRMYRFQISTRSTSYNVTLSISTQIKTALRDKTGTLGTSNFVIQRMFLDGEYDFPEIDPQTKQSIFHRAQDYLVWTTG